MEEQVRIVREKYAYSDGCADVSWTFSDDWSTCYIVFARLFCTDGNSTIMIERTPEGKYEKHEKYTESEKVRYHGLFDSPEEALPFWCELDNLVKQQPQY